MLLELGRRLVKHGVLRERDDVFFLRVEEIEPVARGAAPADVHETIAGRRAEHERNLAITPPFIVVGRFDPDEFFPDAVDGGATTFEGIASSTGVVTGPARVVTRAGEDTVRPGEILVAPFTDPGWTPFFVNAAGIVMDMGGLLSHGSIIAREYGIPAVVNVGPATKIIQTGQMLRVDGDRGIVSVLGAEPGDPGGPDRPVDAPLVRQSAEPDAPAGRGNDSLEDRQVWSNMNTGEVLPDVMTPFSWSVIGPFLDNAFRGIFERIGLGPGERPVSGLIAGRAYFNLTTSVSTMTSLPFSHSVKTEMKNATTVLGGDEASFEALERVMEDAAPLGMLRRLAIFLRWPGFVRWVLWHSPERGELLIAGKRRRIGRLTRVDIASLSDDAIVSLLNGSAGNFLQVGSSILFAFVAMGYFMALDTVCRRWFGDADGPRPRRGGFGRAGGTLARRLVGGVNGMQSAEAGLALWRLAELAGRHEEVAGAILSEQTFEAVRTRIEHDRAGAEFLAQWQAFMREHGHHTRGELEFANPRWSETPDRVLRMVRGHIENGGRESPVARHERLAADRRRLTRECRSRLWNPIKRVIFDYMLKNAQRG
ncbi:MAG: PEP-utilizing enzyme, partial [Planctomycetota bacterium]